MSPVIAVVIAVILSGPRASGDEPTTEAGDPYTTTWSPRERG